MRTGYELAWALVNLLSSLKDKLYVSRGRGAGSEPSQDLSRERTGEGRDEPSPPAPPNRRETLGPPGFKESREW